VQAGGRIVRERSPEVPGNRVFDGALCATGNDALKALVAMQKAPDLILLDNNLPPGAGLSY
jgi:response regulator of citrate/malate metabolism